MHELGCASTGGPGLLHVLRDVPVLGMLVLSGSAATAATYVVAHRRAVRTPVDRVVYEALRSLGFYVAWITAWSMATVLFPCALLYRHELFVGLWYWSGVPLAILQLTWWLSRHAEPRAPRASKEPS